MNKRIFIGSFVEIENLKSHYTKIKKDLSGVLYGSWVKPENFHITYKFIGNVEEEKISEIKTALNSLLNQKYEIDLVVKGLGIFSDRILYFKVMENQKLKEINKLVENNLSKIGFKKEIKPFIPHITLVRIKELKQNQIYEKIKKYEENIFLKQKFLTVDIIESILNPKGAIYQKI